jgi:hypothetical protein
MYVLVPLDILALLVSVTNDSNSVSSTKTHFSFIPDKLTALPFNLDTRYSRQPVRTINTNINVPMCSFSHSQTVNYFYNLRPQKSNHICFCRC